MKTLLTIASVLVLSASPAFAGEGQISKQSLAKMGLSGMQTMSDAQGMQIRGTAAIVIVSGKSTATVPGATSTNSYYATASGSGSHAASGDNFSVAGDATITLHSITVHVVGAGGASSASAH